MKVAIMNPQLLLMLSSLLVPVMAYNCPEIKGCSACQIGLDWSYIYLCPPSRDPSFTIQLSPSKYIHLECRDTLTLSDLYISDLPHAENIATFSLRCALPENKSLIEVTQQMGMKVVGNVIIRRVPANGTLRAKHLAELSDVANLTLTNLGLSNVEENLFEGVPNLFKLNLRNNHVNISKKLFDYVPKLQIVELAENGIEHIEPGTFSSLRDLKILNLWGNKIRKIEPGTFDNLVSLKSLDLRQNLLEEIGPQAFETLLNLTRIDLNENNFTSLSGDMFKNNVHLQKITFYNNTRNLTLPSDIFANLNELKYLGLIRMGLLHLPKHLFSGTPNLTEIYLDRNYLYTLPRSIFKGLKNLSKLTLSFNDIQYLPDGLFEDNTNLAHLDLSINHLTTISNQLFTGLISLVYLNVDRNDLRTIQFNVCRDLQKLSVARFSYNQLTLKVSQQPDEFGYKSPFHYCGKLQELYLAHNNISEIFSDWTISNPNLRILDLKYNKIPYLETADLQFVSNNMTVDLRFNNISYITLNNIEVLAVNQTVRRNVIVKVEHNPIMCTCRTYDFLKYLEGRVHPYVHNFIHIIPGNITCEGPRYMKGIALSGLKSQKLKCLIENSVEQSVCPEECTCWYVPERESFIIDCTFRNLTQTPPMLHDYHRRRVEMNLTGNLLTELPSYHQPGYDQVNVLSARQNNITSIRVDNLLPSLTVLELHNNNLTRIDTEVLNAIANLSLTSITLHNNPWQCDCEAKDFLSFVQTNFTRIPDHTQITCYESGKSLASLTINELCSTTTFIIILSVAIALTGIIIGALAALYYRYSSEIKIWLYAHQWCLWFVTEDELDKDKPYDAFISYSHKDEDFVVNELVPKLEGGPRPFKLCLHYRDWLAGDLIPSQIARSVEESKRTIIVLSPNFLKSVWGTMEFRAAHRQALTEGRARVIVIVYGEVPSTDNLDEELKTYLKMNTYVKWGDRWFWDKLRYALPHPPELRKRNVSKRIFETQQPAMHLNNDKNCLIQSNGNLSAPLSSTPPTEVVVPIFPPSVEKSEKTEIEPTKILNNHDILVGSNLTNNIIINVNNLQCTTV